MQISTHGSVSIRVNRDNTVSVRVGGAVEHLSMDCKDRSQIWDAVKYACISKGLVMSDDALLSVFDMAMREAGRR